MQRLVFTNGCFDLFHAGHLRLLQWAAKHGNRLIVGVNADESVRRLKGEDRPIVPAHERRAIVASLRCVSEAVCFVEDTPVALIRRFHPLVLVKGPEWAGREKEIPGADLVLGWGGRVVCPDWSVDVSTSSIIERIRCGKS